MHSSIAFLLVTALLQSNVPLVAWGQEESAISAVSSVTPASNEEVLEGLIEIEGEINRDIDEHSLQVDYLTLAETALANDNDIVNKEVQLEQLEALEKLQEQTITNEKAYLEEIESEIQKFQTEAETEGNAVTSPSSAALFAGHMFNIAALLLSVGIAAFVTNQAHLALMKRRQGYVSLNPYIQQNVEPI
jgi:hypothetical protein